MGFQRRASRAFPNLEFNIHLFDEEVEESSFEAEIDGDAEVVSGAPARAPLPGDLRVLREASSSTSPVEVSPFDSSTFASRGSTSGT